MYLYHTNLTEVKNVINGLKPKNLGLDNIQAERLKEIQGEIVDPLVYLINRSFTTGQFPNILNIGVIKPLHKSGDKTEPMNYRPISIISNVARIFEKILTSKITFFNKNIISERQFGFQKNKSTEDAIAYLTRYVYEVLVLDGA